VHPNREQSQLIELHAQAAESPRQNHQTSSSGHATAASREAAKPNALHSALLAEADGDTKSSLREPVPDRNEVPRLGAHSQK
jgi:hypothetical protein